MTENKNAQDAMVKVWADLDARTSGGKIDPAILTPGYNPAPAVADVLGANAHNVEDALRTRILEMAREGITIVTYSAESGRVINVPIDVAVRRAVRTEMTQAINQAVLDDLDYLGENYVEVSACANPRESHAEWMGQCYQLHGSSPEYPNFYEACHWGDPVDGIGGYNCDHTVSIYIPGREKRSTSQNPLEGTGYTYADGRRLIGQQRALENTIRIAKREQAVGRALGLETIEADIRIRIKTAELKQLVAEHSAILTYDPRRIDVYPTGFKQAGATLRYSISDAAINRVYIREVRNVNRIVYSELELPSGVSMSWHAYDRMLERKVYLNTIYDAIRNPLHTLPITMNSSGKPSFQMIGKYTTIAIDPENLQITTTWPTSKSKRKKYERIRDINRPTN